MPCVSGEELIGAEAGDENAGGGGVGGFDAGEGVEGGARAAGGEVECEGDGEIHFCGVGVDERDYMGAVGESFVVGDVD